jgi:hypothetical protein
MNDALPSKMRLRCDRASGSNKQECAPVWPSAGPSLPALELGSHEQARERLRAAFGTLDRGPRFRRGKGSERGVGHGHGIDGCADAPGKLVRHVESGFNPSVRAAFSKSWHRLMATTSCRKSSSV